MLPRSLGAIAAAAVPAVAMVLLEPHSVDLSAHDFRSALFGREGFTIWNGQWYSGHHTPAYSVLFPPLAWLLGPVAVGVLSCLAAAALFDPLIRWHFGPAGRWPAIWFGAATGVNLFTGRLPFALGVALGLGALLALQRERLVWAALLSVMCSLASPVAALFLALAGTACLAAESPAVRRGGAAVTAAALAPALALSIAFPEGGHFPFVLSAFVPLAVFAIAALLVVPRSERVLRAGVALYGLGALVAFALETPVGGTVTRLGSMFGGPVLAATVLAGIGSGRRPAATMVAGLLALGAWQWGPAVRDFADAVSDTASEAAFYAPLLGFLDRQEPLGGRVEVVATHAHREAALVADRHPLARGWERRLDIRHNGVFYDGHLDDSTYARWLEENAVRYVALPAASLDYSAEAEARLVERDPAYLRLRWRAERWRVYEVTGTGPLVVPEGTADIVVEKLGRDKVELDVKRPGSALVRVGWTPYWRLPGGCVEPRGDWTRVTVPRPGRAVMTTSFSPARLLSRGRRCG